MPHRVQIGARGTGAPAARVDGQLAARESLLEPAVQVVVGPVTRPAAAVCINGSCSSLAVSIGAIGMGPAAP